jgi:hypothetical protein
MFTSKNYKLLAVSISLLVIGYILLGQGPIDNPLSKSVAPVILVFTYIVMFPWAILAREKEAQEPREQQQKNQGV